MQLDKDYLPKAARRAAERRRQKGAGPRAQHLVLQSLQAKLDGLTAQYHAAEAENRRLKERLAVIEVVLPTREQQARMAAAGLVSSSGAGRPPPSARPAAGAAGGAADADLELQLLARVLQPHSAPSAEPGQQSAIERGPGPSPSQRAVGSGRDKLLAPSPGSFSDSRSPASDPGGASSLSTSTRSGGGQVANTRAGEEAACAQSPPQPPHHQQPPQQRLQLGPPPPGGMQWKRSSPPSQPQPQPQPQPQQAPPSCAATAASLAAATAAVGRGPEAPPQGDDGLSAAWRALWIDWVRDAALLIVTHDARPAGYWLQRLDEVCTQLKTRVVQLGLKHPELIADDMPQLNLDTGRLQEPPEGHWRPVALAMRATPSQVAACRAALALYRERMEVVLAERSLLTERLAESMAALKLGPEQERRQLLSTNHLEKTSVEAEAAAAALDENVAAQGRATKIAKDLLSSDMFTPLQCARGSVASYPYFPDALAIITEVAKLGETAVPATAEQRLSALRSPPA
ncbi:hypothetical protein HXX76_002720 [Chlamydomonas incerta]|uniref:Uncharacterized protein n=1 Tax=Chlamydomonas incerta TaxID=51695 RepID=A0A835TEL1_CHLIN|nr:hypothetical protein HXX76_002720 [Chlamydomonas incerta]|eukprot:KAG2442636.1 hypothetical protein HXX76_002720 [Chlamydomonas incerta]